MIKSYEKIVINILSKLPLKKQQRSLRLQCDIMLLKKVLFVKLKTTCCTFFYSIIISLAQFALQHSICVPMVELR